MITWFTSLTFLFIITQYCFSINQIIEQIDSKRSEHNHLMPFYPPPVPGDIIDSYTLEESIGVGGNATVFKASSPKFGQVALKILHPGKTSDEDIKRFEREYISLQNLHHPNIIKTFETGVHQNYPWLSMELAENGDISSLIDRWKQSSSPKKFEEIRALFIPICDALDKIHQQGLIHRDLKPSNILLTKDGQPKITDFGGVKGKSFSTELTQMGKLVGTVAFMAPEQILGDTLDKRADLYSLGMILYMCLTGQKPFTADNVTGYLSKHITELPPHPLEINPNIPKDLADICFKLLQKEPNKRYSSAKQLLSLLEHQTKPPQLIGREKEFRQLHQVLDSFLGNKQSSLLLLTGQTGVGRKDFIKYVVHQLQLKNIPISTEAKSPSSRLSQYCFWFGSQKPSLTFLEIIQQRLNKKDAIFFLITNTKTAKFIEENLGILASNILIPPLSLANTQELLRKNNITGKRNTLLAQRLHHIFKGRQEYIQEVLSPTFIEEVESTAFKNLADIVFPVPQQLIENYRQHVKKLSAEKKQIIEALIIYQRPLSEQALLKICDQEPKQFIHHCRTLVLEKWLQITNTDEDTIISLSGHLIDYALLQLIPKERQISWHNRIIAIIKKQRRLSITEQQALCYHLKAAGRTSELPKPMLAMSHEFIKQKEWKPAIQSLNDLHQIYKKDRGSFSTDDAYFLFSQLGKAYQAISENIHAIYYYEKAIQIPNIPSQTKGELAAQSCLLQYNQNIADIVLHSLSPTNSLYRGVLQEKAIQSFLKDDQIEAKKCWEQLEKSPFQEDNVIGKAGLFLLEDHGCPLSALWSHLETNCFTIPFIWKTWLIEHYLCVGKWHKALECIQLNISQFLENSTQYLHLLAYEAIIRSLMGQKTQSNQLLLLINKKLTVNDLKNVRIAVILGRAHLYLGLPLPSWTISSVNIDSNIEDLQTQWIALQQRNKNQYTPLQFSKSMLWLQDIVLCDQAYALISPSKEKQETIWKEIQKEHHALRMAISLRFSLCSQNHDDTVFWKQQHQHELMNCIKLFSSSRYNFQNWKN